MRCVEFKPFWKGVWVGIRTGSNELQVNISIEDISLNIYTKKQMAYN